MLLHRINPEKNEARFYLVEAGSSLLDPYVVWRLWGRIGGHQRGMITPCPSAEAAEVLTSRLVQRKIKHGYKPVGETNEPKEEGQTEEKTAAGDPAARQAGRTLPQL